MTDPTCTHTAHEGHCTFAVDVGWDRDAMPSRCPCMGHPTGMTPKQRALALLASWSHGEDCATHYVAEADDAYEDAPPDHEACDCGLRDLVNAIRSIEERS